MARQELAAASLNIAQACHAALKNVSGPVVVGVSGGADSLALAAGVSWAAKRLPITPLAVIVDHQLQEGSDQIAKNAAQQCQKIGVPFVIETVQVVSQGTGMEAAARTARRSALQKHPGPVLLGHTLDDQAETVLLGLARGSGIRSLAGMASQQDNWIRPLLAITHETTVLACQEQGIEIWNDPHNWSYDFTRVRVRRTVLPILEEQLGPGIAQALARTALLARADADALDDWAKSVSATVIQNGDLLVNPLMELPEAVASRVLRNWLIKCGAVEPSLQHVLSVMQLVTNWHGQSAINLPKLKVSRIGKRLIAE